MTVRSLHNMAMQAADLAQSLQRSGKDGLATRTFSIAAALELEAIDAMTEESVWFTERELRESAYHLLCAAGEDLRAADIADTAAS